MKTEKVMGTYDGVVYPHGRFTGIIGTYTYEF